MGHRLRRPSNREHLIRKAYRPTRFVHHLVGRKPDGSESVSRKRTIDEKNLEDRHGDLLRPSHHRSTEEFDSQIPNVEKLLHTQSVDQSQSYGGKNNSISVNGP